MILVTQAECIDQINEGGRHSQQFFLTIYVGHWQERAGALPVLRGEMSCIWRLYSKNNSGEAATVWVYEVKESEQSEMPKFSEAPPVFKIKSPL